jgi:general secretion pathway protein C
MTTARRSDQPSVTRAARLAAAARARLPSAPAHVAIAAVAAIVCELGLRLLAAPSAPRTRPPPTAVAAGSPSPTGLVRTIAAAGLFGADRAADHGSPAAGPLLVLVGVIATGDPAGGFGIVGVDVAHTALYAVGARLPNGASLREVHADRVLTERDGAQQWLRLPRHALLGLSALPAAAVADADTAAVDAAPDPIGYRRLLAGAAGVAQSWAAGLDAAPLREGRGTSGLALDPSPRLQRDYGLRPGDVLTAVDGEPVTDTARLPQLLARGVGGAVSLTIVRDGTPLSVQVTPST